jgi:sulfoacetaldehyde dehydrogenase|tara:strand:+ start:108 stop:1433 length:1326 start_codon:yes stop_codon:yes gene_type:complete
MQQSRLSLGRFIGRRTHVHRLNWLWRRAGLGNVEDKVSKNQRKTIGTLRDLLRAKTVGMVSEDRVSGISKYAKPVGLVAAVTPSTNPAATPINKSMMAIKGRNAIIVAPPPSAWRTAAMAVDLARSELGKIGVPQNLIQVLPEPVTYEATRSLMEQADLVVATGAQDRVRDAYKSGTPALGVGAGNVPVIVDSSADLAAAARLIAASKSFDNGTSCSSESALIILDDVYEATVKALEHEGGYRADGDERRRIISGLFPGGRLNREIIAKDFRTLHKAFKLHGSNSARFIMVEEPEPHLDLPLSREKISLVLTLYRARNFEHAVLLVLAILEIAGRGHSAGIHTSDRLLPHLLAETLPVARVLVNQAHAVGNGGSFDNGLPFSLSMGCGTWAGNSISENLNVRHFINTTRLVEVRGVDEPTAIDLFKDHCCSVGDLDSLPTN